MPRLSSMLFCLPYYWWRKTDTTSQARLAAILELLEAGNSLSPEDRELLQDAPVHQRYLAPVGRELDRIDAAMLEVRRSRDLDWAWGWVLDLLAMNAGVKRPYMFYGAGQLPDFWMRELVRLFVFAHNSRATPDDILVAAAWFLGIAWREEHWRTEFLPQLRLVQNQITSPLGRHEPRYVELHLPWKLVALYANDHFYVADTRDYPVGEGFWLPDAERGLDAGILDGHHLLTDLIAFLRHILPCGVRLEIFGTGFYVADTDNWPVGTGFWIPDAEHGLDAGRMPGLLEDGALEPMDEREYEQLRVAPFSYAAMQKELVNYKIRYKDGAYTD